MNLKQLLRQDFTLYIRPHFEKSECEVCGSCTEHLHVHHMTHFKDLLDETLQQLKLELHEDTDSYTEEELQLIRNVMLGKQMRIKYVTCCEPCHLELHEGSYSPTGKRKRHENYIMSQDELEVLINNLEILVDKCIQDKFTFIKKDGLRRISNSLQLYDFNKHFCLTVRSINNQLKILELPYEIVQGAHTYRKNGKMNIFRYYIVVRTDEKN